MQGSHDETPDTIADPYRLSITKAVDLDNFFRTETAL